MTNKVFRCLASVFFAVLLLLQAATAAVAQTPANTPEMADTLRQSGKIYVVVTVVVVIVAGLLAYLVSLDRKVSRLEKEIKS